MEHPRGGELALAGRVAYAVLFCLVLPGLLILWAHATGTIVGLPVYGSWPMAVVLAGLGLAFLVGGMGALWRHGGGLPMNVFPPPRLVVSGVYRIFPHPIYAGFCLIVFGVAMAARSASGLWLVAPITVMGSVALVYGYERPDLHRRFGAEALKPIRCLPPATSERPGFRECLAFFLFVQIPWLAIYEVVAVVGVQRGSLDTRLPFEAQLPVWTWTEAIYASTYVVALTAPVMTNAKRDLRALMIRSWLAMALVFPLYVFLPTHAPFRPFEGGGALGDLLRLERALDMPAEACPSFHVIWAILAACAFRSRLAGLWAAAVCVSCVMNGMHAITDVIAGAGVAVLLVRVDRVLEVSAPFDRTHRQWLARMADRPFPADRSRVLRRPGHLRLAGNRGRPRRRSRDGCDHGRRGTDRGRDVGPVGGRFAAAPPAVWFLWRSVQRHGGILLRPESLASDGRVQRGRPMVAGAREAAVSRAGLLSRPPGGGLDRNSISCIRGPAYAVPGS